MRLERLSQTRPRLGSILNKIQMRHLIFPLLLIASVASAQVAIQKADPIVQAKSQSMTSSLSYFSSGDFTHGEAVLEENNVAAVDTASWHTESAMELIMAMHALENTGNPATAYALARIALGHLQMADAAYNASSNQPEVAQEKTMQGMLYERYFGDRVTAEKSYSAAIALYPQASVASARLKRLQAYDVAEAQKLQAASQAN